MATPNYEVDLNDKRLTSVKAEEKDALDKSKAEYDGMVSNASKVYDDAINSYGVMDENGNWNEGSMAAIQTDIANKNTQFAIDEIERQKAEAKQDYTKEQAGAYVDWQKQSNPYGVEAEKQAAAGLHGSGYSESMQVSMYNTYQNRVATAREAFVRATADYNAAITEARLQNSSLLAEIANEALKARLQLSIESLQYNNELLTKAADRKLQIQQLYSTKYQDVLDQINKENALAEEVRQADMANARQQEQIKLAQKELKLQQDKFDYEKEQNAKAEAAAEINKDSGGGSGGAKSEAVAGAAIDSDSIKKQANKKQVASASEYLEALIASGASKDKISNEISLAVRNGALSATEAANLRRAFTPRGVQY